MDSKVVTLLPHNAHCVEPAEPAELAARLRRIADRLEAGDYGQLERVGVLLETPTAVATRFYGRPTTRVEGVGLLEFAKHNIINDSED